MRRLLILTLLLIVYGSLYPWRFHAIAPGVNPFAVLLHSWPTRFYRAMAEDFGLNIIIYVPCGFCAFLAFSRGFRSNAAILAATFLGVFTSTAVEIAQQWVLFRSTSLGDVASNSLGAFCGAVLGWFVLHRSLTDWAEHWLHRADALLLALGWVAWQIFPVTPFLTRSGDVVLALRLTDHSGPLIVLDFLLCVAETLALAHVVEAVTGTPLRQSRQLRTGFGCLLLLVPLKALIWGRGVSAVEVAAAGVAWLIAVYLPRIPGIAVLLAALIVIDGLRPFHFASVPTTFNWVPFRDSLEADWFTGTPVLLGKAFRYTAVAWLLVEGRWRWGVATTAVAIVLAAIEVVQIHLPGRTASVTDPLLPFLAAFSMWAARDTFDSLPRAPQVR